MNIFAFILGREQKIALAELEAVLRRFCIGFDILSLHQGVVIIKTRKAFSCQLSAVRLMRELGGTVKIYEINQNAKCKMQNFGMETYILEVLKENNSSGTLNFGISDYSGKYSVQEMNKMGIAIKIKARKARPVRFISNRERELSSATSYHKIFKTGGEEFGIFENQISNIKNQNCNSKIKINYNNNLSVGRLVAVSNPDEWSRRDYGKPAGDKFSGMMPPKLARAMVNIALDPRNSKSKTLNSKQIQNSNFENSKIVSDLGFRNSDLRPMVVDPFCGSGNILMEAALLGCDIIGSDISEKAVEDTKTNLRWLMQNLKIKNQNYNLKINNLESVFLADATSADFTKKLKPNSYNLCIVTEPYLGKPKKVKVERAKAKGEVLELKKLYLGFFNNLKLLATHYPLLTICFVFPIIETLDGGPVSLYRECLDDLREMGYNTLCTLEYGRDYQIVKRYIALLQLKNRRT